MDIGSRFFAKLLASLLKQLQELSVTPMLSFPSFGATRNTQALEGELSHAKVESPTIVRRTSAGPLEGVSSRHPGLTSRLANVFIRNGRIPIFNPRCEG